MPTRKIDDLLTEGHSKERSTRARHTPLNRLLHTAANQKQWTAQLRALLEPPLCHEVEVTQIQGSVATLLCSSSAAATRLRFVLPDLLPQLQALASFSSVRDCNIRVVS